MHAKYCFVFKVYVHYIEWKQARILWIGFHKNDKNKKCLLQSLGKDVVKQIITFVGPLKTPIRIKNSLFI